MNNYFYQGFIKAAVDRGADANILTHQLQAADDLYTASVEAIKEAEERFKGYAFKEAVAKYILKQADSTEDARRKVLEAAKYDLKTNPPPPGAFYDPGSGEFGRGFSELGNAIASALGLSPEMAQGLLGVGGGGLLGLLLTNILGMDEPMLPTLLMALLGGWAGHQYKPTGPSSILPRSTLSTLFQDRPWDSPDSKNTASPTATLSAAKPPPAPVAPANQSSPPAVTPQPSAGTPATTPPPAPVAPADQLNPPTPDAFKEDRVLADTPWPARSATPPTAPIAANASLSDVLQGGSSADLDALLAPVRSSNAANNEDAPSSPEDYADAAKLKGFQVPTTFPLNQHKPDYSVDLRTPYVTQDPTGAMSAPGQTSGPVGRPSTSSTPSQANISPAPVLPASAGTTRPVVKNNPFIPGYGTHNPVAPLLPPEAPARGKTTELSPTPTDRLANPNFFKKPFYPFEPGIP